MKKGQITIFLILGILLVGGAGFYFFGNSKKQIDSTTQTETKIFTNPVENHVQQCVEKTAKDALLTAGLNGGIENASEHILFFGGKTPYYYGTQNSGTPTLNDIQNFLSEYASSNIKTCVNFSLFKDYTITDGDLTANVKIGDKNVVFTIDYPVKISKDNSVQEITKFSTTINSRLKLLHNISLGYINEQKTNPKYICMTCLVNAGVKNNVKINTYTLGNTVGFNIMDNSTKLDNQAYNYDFAVKYPEAAQ